MATGTKCLELVNETAANTMQDMDSLRALLHSIQVFLESRHHVGQAELLNDERTHPVVLKCSIFKKRNVGVNL